MPEGGVQYEEQRRKRRRRKPRVVPSPSRTSVASYADEGRRLRTAHPADRARRLGALPPGAAPPSVEGLARARYPSRYVGPRDPTLPSTAEVKRTNEDIRQQAFAINFPGIAAHIAANPEYQSMTRSMETLAGSGLGPLLPGGTPAYESDKKWLPADIAGLLPVFRGPRALAAGIKAVRAGEPVSGLARPAVEGVRRGGPVQEAWTSRPILDRVFAPGRGLTGSRRVAYNELAAQALSSPSLITAHGQRLMDRAFEVTGRSADALRRSDSVLARALGATITPVSSRAKVPKLQGKRRLQQQRRVSAGRAEEFRQVHTAGAYKTTVGPFEPRIPLKRKEGYAMAHAWYAQLPEAYRNADGLELVRAKQAEELEAYTSGAVGRQLDQSLEETRQVAWEARMAGDSETVYAALAEVERLKWMQRDIPSIIEDLGGNITKLDRLVKNAPDPDEGLLATMRAISDDIEEIGLEAGLNVERAAGRTGLVARWLGLEEDGTEMFFPHRLGRTSGVRPSLTSGGVATGEVRKPKGLFQQNELALASTGRMRQDLQVLLETWQERQIYRFNLDARGDLMAMGPPPDLTRGVKAGREILINPKGHSIPRTWARDPEKQARLEGFDNVDDVVVRDTEEFLHNTYAGMGDNPEQEIADMLAKATEYGHLEDLRVVPVDVVKRYFGQFVPAKISVTTLGGKAGGNLLGKGADMFNDLLYISLIYSNPGYIPAALVGNLAMAALHQGPYMAVNLVRAGQILTQGPQRLRDLLRAEVGHGGTVSASSGTRGLSRVAPIVGAVPDDGPRFAAFLYEASKMGVISKEKAWLSKADFKKLERFLTDKNARPILDDVRDRAVQAMVDFERLGPMERALAKRFLFVWPWIRGATRYPGRFALDHPIRTGILTYAALEGRDYLEEHTVGADEGPYWLQQGIKTSDFLGKEVIGGHPYPTVLKTAPVSPLATPWEMYQSAIGAPGARTIGAFANPGLQAAAKTAFGLVEGRGGNFYNVGYGEAAKTNLERLAPNFGLAKDLVNPSGEGLYPGDESRAGRLLRAARVWPIPYDPEEAQEMAAIQPSAEEERRTDMGADLKRAKRLYSAVGEKLPAEYEQLARREMIRDLTRDDMKENLDVESLTEAQEVTILMQLAFEDIPEMGEFEDEWLVAFEEARGDPLDQPRKDRTPSGKMHQLRLQLNDLLGFNLLGQYETILNRIEDSQMAAAGG